MKWTTTALLALLIAFPFITPNDYFIRLASIILIYAIAASGINLLMGYTGQFSFGHAGFIAIGSYVSAIASKDWGWSFWVTAPMALVVAGIFGYILGLPALRVKNIYLALVTVGFGISVQHFLMANVSLTHGPAGIQSIPKPAIGSLVLSGSMYYYFTLVMFIIVFWYMRNVLTSYWGLVFQSIRDSEIAASSSGIRVSRYKLISFVLSAVLAALAGVLLAHLYGYISPDIYNLDLSVLLILMVVLGGLGLYWAPVVGAAILLLLPEFFRVIEEWQLFIHGLLMIFVLMILPKGIIGKIRSWTPQKRVKAQETDRPVRKLKEILPMAEQVKSNEPMLVLSNVGKSFDGLRAVDQVNVQIESGKIYGLIGPNGSGKSTLLNLISGIYPLTDGEITFFGDKIGSLPTYQRAKKGISRTFQTPQLFKDMTVLQNVMVGRYLQRDKLSLIQEGFRTASSKKREAELKERCQDLLATVEVGKDANMLVSHIPYGHQRQTEIVRALASQPKLLLLDEPAAGLNAEELHQLGLLIQDIRDAGITVIIVEHHMDLIMSICDEIVVLNSGQVIAQGTPKEIQSNQKVIDAYLGTQEGA